ncbi:MAG: RagB/SusD family nutrient uptake outer membrane protein [Prevotellaceae bacterium]|nr:RagB/SusD family nutrient uptake outer membrane protein [Prevotellaceae bacterium]
MKNFIRAIVIVTIVCGMSSSCKDYLDIGTYFDDELKLDTVFAQKRYVEAYLWGAAAMFPDDGAIYRNPYTPGPYASDESFTLAGLDEYRGMGYVMGEINSSNIGYASFGKWGNRYKIIRICNTFFARVNEAKDWETVAEKNLLIGYARFFRAFAYYDLLMDFGPPILVGDELVAGNEAIEYYDRPRALYDEAIEYICSEFEEAAHFLPTQQTVMNFGRPTKGAAYGLIARLRLIHASPLFNGGTASHIYYGNWIRKADGKHYIQQNYDEKRWAVAAAACKRIMDLTDAGKPRYSLYKVDADENTPDLPTGVVSDPDFYQTYPNGAAGIDPYRSYSEMFTGEAVAAINPEFVWGRLSSAIEDMIRRSFPIQTSDWSENCVPQKIIDNFRMIDGRTIYESSPDYPYSETGFMSEPKYFSGYILNPNSTSFALQGQNPATVSNMYNNREARFYASIGFCECHWPMSSTTTSMKHDLIVRYYYDSPNGKSAAHTALIYTATGYVTKKYIHPVDAFGGDNNRRMPKAFGIIRYAEILLSYAEALNNLTGTHTVELDNVSYTVSRNVEEMKKAFNQVRYRAGLPGASAADLASTPKFFEIIKQERMIELLHENRRYYDVRRWGIYLEEDGQPVTGMNTDATKENFYQRVVVNSVRVTSRIVDKKMVFLPIVKDEVRRLPSFDQNPGWED